MSLLPLELRNTTDDARAATEVERAMRAARKRIARRETLDAVASTLAIPVGASALWIGISRFTLVDLPPYAVLSFMFLWLMLMLVVTRTHRFSPGHLARFVDRALSLDERASTLLELVRATPVLGLSSTSPTIPQGLLADTAFQIKANSDRWPSSWNYRLKNWQTAAIGAALAALVATILLPTALDSVRAERAALQRTANTELNEIAQLKAEVVARPGLTDTDRQAIVSQLDSLTQSLSAGALDRSSMLAALSDAQQKLQALSPQTTSDFANILQAARTMQLVTLNASRNAPPGTSVDWSWSPDNFPDLSELGKAASAANTLSDLVKYLNANQSRIAVPLLQRASTEAAPDDADLAQHLLDSSTAIGAKDVEKGVDALKQTAQAFLQQDQRFQLTQSVEKIMTNLDQGRQTLAQAGTQSTKKGQVGFRRPGAQPPNPAPAGQGGAQSGKTQGGAAGNQDNTDSGAGHGLSVNGPSALGAPMGSNSPDYGSLKGGTGGTPGTQPGAGQGADQKSTQPGSGPGTQPGAAGSSGGSQPGAGSSGTSDGTQGTFTGQISGPVGGGAGAISQVPNPQGQGLSDGSQPPQSTAQPLDSIYVPPPDPTGAATAGSQLPVGVPGQAAPAEQPGAIQGRGADGGDGPQTPSDNGAGARNQMRTPYKNVIGNYVQQATQALDKVYVPADAREYVKEYFTSLGK